MPRPRKIKQSDMGLYTLVPAHPWDYGLTPAPPICAVFGCGKPLSHEEQLYGGKCSQHSLPGEIVNKKLTNGIKYLP